MNAPTELEMQRAVAALARDPYFHVFVEHVRGERDVFLARLPEIVKSGDANAAAVHTGHYEALRALVQTIDEAPEELAQIGDHHG